MKLKLFMRPLAVLAIAGVLVSCGEKETPIEPGEDDKTETVDPTPEPEPEPEPEPGQTFKYVNFCADLESTGCGIHKRQSRPHGYRHDGLLL